MKKCAFVFIVFNILISSKIFSQKNINYFNEYFHNWSHDSVSNFFMLKDYQLGTKSLYPNICNISFNSTKKDFKVVGFVTYPALNNYGGEIVAQTKIVCAVPSDERNKVKYVTDLGFSDSLGNFSFTLSNAPSNFFILFSKGQLIPAAVEFNLPSPKRRENWNSISGICLLNNNHK